MSNYPLPRQAAYIWAAGDRIMLAFPPVTGSDKGHSVSLPNTTQGLSQSLEILHERAFVAFDRQTIGNRSAPTQHQVENDRRYKAFVAATAEQKAEKDEAIRFLEELGL